MQSSIIIYGAGAIGCTFYAWLKPYYDDLILLARGKTADTIRKEGLTIYENTKDASHRVSDVKMIEKIDDVSEVPKMVIITVKNYSLEDVCKNIKNSFPDDDLLIVTLQNGVENLKILPKYFSRVIYGVICYNAWRDVPNCIGYKKKGPIILGTPSQSLSKEINETSKLLNKGFPCEITSYYNDAAHNKILLNLTNALFTLIGLGFHQISSLVKFRILTTAIMSEGLKIVKKAGFKEVKLGSLPSWTLLQLASLLPGFITNSIFKNTIRKTTGVNSMAQDLLINKSNQTELESLNGYFVQLAKSLGINAKYNQKLYEVCNQEFSKENFHPLTVDLVWEEFKEIF